jgi:hypothetical protein
MACLPIPPPPLYNLGANKKSASFETILHLIRYLASLEDFCVRFCMHLLQSDHLLHRRLEQVQKGVRSGLDGLVRRTGRGYNPRQTLI